MPACLKQTSLVSAGTMGGQRAAEAKAENEQAQAQEEAEAEAPQELVEASVFLG